MATIYPTKLIRTMQKLWSSLDTHLAPRMHNGVILALSGGPDSRALLEAVASWKGRHLGRVIIASCDHGVRAESLPESKLVLMRAKRLGFEGYLQQLLNFENNGENELRERRYDFLRSLCRRYQVEAICTAHHRDDNSEGFLMDLLGLGGGVMGAAMREVETFGSFNLIRPFLSLMKNDLRLALTLLCKGDYAQDSLDDAQKGRRAFVRHTILPACGRYSPGFASRLELASRRQRELVDEIKVLSREIITWNREFAVIEIKKAFGVAVLEEAIKLALKGLQPGKDLRGASRVVKEVIKKIISQNSQNSPDMAGLDQSLKWFNVSNLSTKAYFLPGAKLILDGGKIVVHKV